jgi:hypothetical protein
MKPLKAGTISPICTLNKQMQESKEKFYKTMLIRELYNCKK